MKRKRIIGIAAGIFLIGIATLYTFVEHATLLTYIHQKNLDRETLDRSLLSCKQFLLANQLEDGRFNYEYDFVNDKFSQGDSQVRQAGALWGVSLIHLEIPSSESRKAIEKGLAFFASNSVEAGSNGRYIVYPDQGYGRTGTMSLATLSLIDFLRSEPDHPERMYYDSLLMDYIKFLVSLRTQQGSFYASYDYKTGKGRGSNSPYFDGETLLALCKAAKFLGYDSLKNPILESAEYMYDTHVAEARKKEPDSNQTKGFYQWGSMSFYEIYEAGWGNHWAERTIELAFWMIDTHRTLMRTRNTAYAHEGLASAWQLAKLSGDNWAVKKIGTVIDIGLSRLISWQVGGPLQNDFLEENPPVRELAFGGVMNKKDEPLLRIDVTQHQSHAILLARRFIYLSN